MEDIKEKAKGKGSRGPYNLSDNLPPPEFIKLPDGRLIPLAPLMYKQTNTKFHNLLTKGEQLVKNKNVNMYNMKSPSGKRVADVGNGRKSKYTLEERMFHRTASVDEIAKRYNMSKGTARATKHYANRMFTETETGLIINHTLD